jgi:UDP-glucose 4-epimerase
MIDYLIIGGTGSLGKKLIERLLPTSSIAVYSRDESKHWTIRNELLSHKQISRLSFYVGDIRDKQRLRDVIQQTSPKNIIIAAALKHVDTCELSPNESVSTNVIGTQNVIDVINSLNSLDSKSIQNTLYVSTDKSCSPVNTYGMCKAISERLITSQVNNKSNHIKYLAVRYGNVLESRGSIIPLFKYQAENSEILTVTDPEMTRFVMTLDDSVDLILTALKLGKCGETWIPIIPAMKIGDLATLFSKKFNKKIKITGHRPGEKMHEDLINESESSRTKKFMNYYVISSSHFVGRENVFTYSSSDDVMTPDTLEKFLNEKRIFDKTIDEFKGQSIEEIATNRVD